MSKKDQKIPSNPPKINLNEDRIHGNKIEKGRTADANSDSRQKPDSTIKSEGVNPPPGTKK